MSSSNGNYQGSKTGTLTLTVPCPLSPVHSEGEITGLTATEAHIYSYDNPQWGDVLTSYNGQPVTYDAMGNITSLSGETYTWTAGRQLSRITKADNSYVDYFYDDNGQMSYFNVYEDNILVGTYNYLWDNTKLVGVQVTEYEADENNNLTETKTIINRIIYDADGEPLGYLLEDSVPYLYIKHSG